MHYKHAYNLRALTTAVSNQLDKSHVHPSFYLYIYPKYFRIEHYNGEQKFESSHLMRDGPMKQLLQDIRNQVISPHFVPWLDNMGIKFYDGYLLVEIVQDLDNPPSPASESHTIDKSIEGGPGTLEPDSQTSRASSDTVIGSDANIHSSSSITASPLQGQSQSQISKGPKILPKDRFIRLPVTLSNDGATKKSTNAQNTVDSTDPKGKSSAPSSLQVTKGDGNVNSASDGDGTEKTTEKKIKQKRERVLVSTSPLTLSLDIAQFLGEIDPSLSLNSDANLELERQILNLTSTPLCLDPDPMLGRAANWSLGKSKWSEEKVSKKRRRREEAERRVEKRLKGEGKKSEGEYQWGFLTAIMSSDVREKLKQAKAQPRPQHPATSSGSATATSVAAKPLTAIPPTQSLRPQTQLQANPTPTAASVALGRLGSSQGAISGPSVPLPISGTANSVATASPNIAPTRPASVVPKAPSTPLHLPGTPTLKPAIAGQMMQPSRGTPLPFNPSNPESVAMLEQIKASSEPGSDMWKKADHALEQMRRYHASAAAKMKNGVGVAGSSGQIQPSPRATPAQMQHQQRMVSLQQQQQPSQQQQQPSQQQQQAQAKLQQTLRIQAQQQAQQQAQVHAQHQAQVQQQVQAQAQAQAAQHAHQQAQAVQTNHNRISQLINNFRIQNPEIFSQFLPKSSGNIDILARMIAQYQAQRHLVNQTLANQQQQQQQQQLVAQAQAAQRLQAAQAQAQAHGLAGLTQGMTQGAQQGQQGMQGQGQGQQNQVEQMLRAAHLQGIQNRMYFRQT